MPICSTPCKLADFDAGRMVQVARRGVSGPTLIRLLARLTDADVSESRQPLSDRLSLWLGWTDAIALSTVLDGGPLAVTINTKPFDNAQLSEYERMRAALHYAIADEKAYSADVFVPTRRGATAPAALSPSDAQSDYAIYRKRYQTIQQAMDTNIAKLRGSLRATLNAQTPARARLAVVDAILERSLSIQERRLLGMVPGLLEKHFLHLRQSAQQADKEAQERAAQVAETEPAAAEAPPVATTPDTTTPSPAAPTMMRAMPLANTRLVVSPRSNKPTAPVVPLWLATFRRDMRSVLLAELDIRLQPIEGLLAALRDS